MKKNLVLVFLLIATFAFGGQRVSIEVLTASGATYVGNATGAVELPVSLATFPTIPPITVGSVSIALPASFSHYTVNPLTPGSITTPADTIRVNLQVTTMGKQVWFAIGSTTAAINGSDSELLTWAAEFDCGPGIPIGYISSESAVLVIRAGKK